MASASVAGGRSLLGNVRSRVGWGADESLRSGKPKYASAVSAVVAHHIAGRNDYAPSDAQKKIRADYAYHVWSRGYNLFVDKYGSI